MPRPRTPTRVLEVTGAFLRNPARLRAREHEIEVDGQPLKPGWLQGRGGVIWDEILPVAYWLTAADGAMFAGWCALTVEVEQIATMKASRIRTWTRLGNSLGFDLATRARLGIHAPVKPTPQNPKTARFFR